MPSPATATLLALAALLAPPPRPVPLPGAVLRVGPGRAFATIQPAIDAAAHGDLILVDAGTYPAFAVDGKSVAILADQPGTPFEVLLQQGAPAIRVRNLAAGQPVTVQGCFVRVGTGAAPALALEQCAGAVRLRAIRLEPVADLPAAALRAVVEIRACAAAALSDVSVAPAAPRQGQTYPGVPVGSGVDHGIAALLVEASAVRLTRCTLVGYDNSLAPATGRYGGDGVRILGSGTVRVDGAPTRIAGGAGGESGGNALHHLGAGGPDVLSCGVNPGAFVAGGGPFPGGILAVRHDRGRIAPGIERFVPACLFEAAGTVEAADRCAIGTSCALDLASFFARPFWLFLGPTGHGRVPGIENPLYLDDGSPLLLGVAAGNLASPPVARVVLAVPALPSLVGLQLSAQAVLGAPAGAGGPAFAFTTAAPFTIVP
ncbi:MAG: hypothetical protein IT458_18375 [Planctomycetes bacterium]|nr:hypothetical protein [Planctomycetota bacterium]